MTEVAIVHVEVEILDVFIEGHHFLLWEWIQQPKESTFNSLGTLRIVFLVTDSLELHLETQEQTECQAAPHRIKSFM